MISPSIYLYACKHIYTYAYMYLYKYISHLQTYIGVTVHLRYAVSVAFSYALYTFTHASPVCVLLYVIVRGGCTVEQTGVQGLPLFAPSEDPR